jgi:hypothetical protein
MHRGCDGSWVTFTLADGTLGRFGAAPAAGTNPDAYTAIVIGKLSSDCKGDLMSGKQSVPLSGWKFLADRYDDAPAR